MARTRSESRLALRTDAPAPAQPPCLLHVRVTDIGRLDETMDRWKDLCRHAAKLGLNGLLVEPVWQRGGEADQPLEAGPDRGLDAAPADADTSSMRLGAQPMAQALGQMAHAAGEHGLALVLEVVLDRVARHAVPTTADPAWLAPPADEPARDPRLSPAAGQVVSVHTAPMPDACVAAWRDRLAGWLACGVRGFCFDAPQRLAVADWHALLGPLRGQAPQARLLAWTHGLSPEALAPLAEVGFDGVFSSLPWWDYRADWLLHEDHRLRAVAPVIAPVALADASQPGDRRALWAAAVSGDGMLVPSTLLLPQQEIAQAVAFLKSRPARSIVHAVAGQDRRPTALVRRQAVVQRQEDAASEAAAVLVINWRDDAPVEPDWPLLAGLLPPGIPRRADGQPADAEPLAPGACACFLVGGEGASQTVHAPAYSAMKRTAGQRLAIENVAPAVDDGAFPPKTPAGRAVVVRADLILDGHDELAGEVRWRALDEEDWRSVPLEPLGNDRWQASFCPSRVGRHEFVVAAWRDAWSTFVHELSKKHEAGLALGVEIMDGTALLRAASARAQGRQGNAEAGRVVKQALKTLGEVPKPVADGQALPAESLPETTPERVAVLRDPALARAMRELDDRPFQSSTPPYPLWVDRPQAEFASWYELFPRSQAAEPGRHGTFADVARRLPALRAMGFDVLYFPPIHPIGQRNRKGRNNSLKAQPGDVGSPYAIGAADGGHDAVHRDLGTLEDFLALVRAAREHGLEIALDFAIQCSPDHPWLAEHPDWFSRRADGSIRYAENPPKKYEDIVNVEFYGAAGKRARKTALWEALREVVLFWVDKGVRIFRVDNPHTKPLPFWEWLIDTVQARHPDVVFLSEAFTRPKMMYRLAKIGFTQSYTYFTWRHGKQELIDYLHELSRPPVADFFRPNFFVNTPDINPYFLQRSGRAGFLIRAALAATASGLWGMYSGFELCESAPVPGKEEYLDSEKYELRQRDWNQPGNINAEIARLNLIRRQNPALQTHRGFHVAHCPNEQVLCFWKAASARANVVLVAISLDPHGAQHADITLSGWRGEARQRPGLHAEDLVHGGSEFWQDERGHVLLTPEQPYRIWRLSEPD